MIHNINKHMLFFLLTSITYIYLKKQCITRSALVIDMTATVNHHMFPYL